MKPNEFRQLAPADQWDLITMFEPVANRDDEYFNYELYMIDAMYVEAAYLKAGIKAQRANSEGKAGLRCFTSADTPLIPYLQQIEINID